MAEAIKTAVRIRPLSHDELRNGSASVVRLDRLDGLSATVLTNPTETFPFDYGYCSPDRSPSSSSREAPHERVQLGSSSPGMGSWARGLCEAAFTDIGQAMVRDALNGYSSCVLAYGQTGSGKSSSILGTTAQPGLASRCIGELVSRRPTLEADPGAQLRIRISCVEVHNDRIRDLLSANEQAHDFEVIEHPKVDMCVPNLTEAVCQTPADVMRLLGYAKQRQASRATQLSATSTRSHTIFTVKVERVIGSRPRPDGAQPGQVLHAKAVFVDLAGGEYQGFDRQRAGDSRLVDQGLSALASAVARLGQGESRASRQMEATFRESTLTTLLKDSLVGQSRTYVMACVSPLEEDIPETLATLRFAAMARQIRTSPQQHWDRSGEVIESLQADIATLRDHMAHERVGLDTDAQTELTRLELLLDHSSANFEMYLENSRLLEEEQHAALVRRGLLQRDCGETTPYLLNMSNDPMFAGCLVHHLPKNQPTTIGSADGNSIPMRGLGIPQHLCKITNRGNSELNIMRVSPVGRLSINGRSMVEGEVQKLHHGDKVYIGRAYAVRVVVPVEESPGVDTGLSLQGLEDEWSGVGELPSWESLRSYLEQVEAQMQPSQARHLFEEMKKACQLCEEANELTLECRPEENLHFEVDLTSAVPSSVVIRVLHTDPLCDDGAEDSTRSVLYLWSLPVMAERIERMRNYHEAQLLGEEGTSPLDPLLDPWHEAHPGAVAQRLAELELMLTMEREASTRSRRQQHSAIRRKLELRESFEDESCVREVLGAWSASARAARRPKDRTAGCATSASAKQVPARASSPSKVAPRRETSPGRPSSPPRSARTLGKAVEASPRREEDEAGKSMDASQRMRRQLGSFDFNYRGGFKAGAVQHPKAATKTPTPSAPRPIAQTPVRSPSVGKRAQGQAASKKGRTPAAPRGAAAAGERSEEGESTRTPGPSPSGSAPQVLPPSEQAEQLSFVSSDGKMDEELGGGSVHCTINGAPLYGDADARSDGGTVSRFISGIVTGNTSAATGDGEDGARAAEAYETMLLKRQLEQAWQLGNALRSQMPEREQQPSGTGEEPARPIVAPPAAERQQQPSYSNLIQAPAGRPVWGVASPWPPTTGAVSPRYADGHVGQLEGLSTLPRCVVTYTTTSMVPSRSPTPFVARAS